jgi:hypothetical protein
MRIVTNASPLIFLTKIDSLRLLQQCFSGVLAPPGVVAETGLDLPDFVEQSRLSGVGEAFVRGALGTLHRGEVETLVLARERNIDLVAVDDGAARRKLSRWVCARSAPSGSLSSPAASDISTSRQRWTSSISLSIGMDSICRAQSFTESAARSPNNARMPLKNTNRHRRRRKISMVLKALTLENFKGIREPVRIEFEPLTLLFGANNAGKSTIVQALMYAREVLERNNCDAGRTQLGGEVVDLGGWIGRAVSLTPSARMIFSTVSYRGLAPGLTPYKGPRGRALSRVPAVSCRAPGRRPARRSETDPDQDLPGRQTSAPRCFPRR